MGHIVVFMLALTKKCLLNWSKMDFGFQFLFNTPLMPILTIQVIKIFIPKFYDALLIL
jgi:hypothetical protein